MHRLILMLCFAAVSGFAAEQDNTDVLKNLDVFELEVAADPQISPDGKRIAYFTHDVKTQERDIHVMDIDGRNSRQLTDVGRVNEDPFWSPDGKFIVFQSNRTGNYQIFKMKADGSEQQCLSKNKNSEYWPSWSWIKVTDHLKTDQ